MGISNNGELFAKQNKMENCLQNNFNWALSWKLRTLDAIWWEGCHEGCVTTQMSHYSFIHIHPFGLITKSSEWLSSTDKNKLQFPDLKLDLLYLFNIHCFFLFYNKTKQSFLTMFWFIYIVLLNDKNTPKYLFNRWLGVYLLLFAKQV